VSLTDGKVVSRDMGFIWQEDYFHAAQRSPANVSNIVYVAAFDFYSRSHVT
jgi:hypothetical protein